MRAVSLLSCVTLLAACAKGGEQAAATLNLADVAGKWTVQNMAEGSDSVLSAFELNATGTTEGWTMTFPGREPMALHLTTGGDSVVIHVGPFESVLRPGVQVTTESTMRLVNGQLEGRAVAHYQVAGADSVRVLRQRGTRAQ